MDPAAREEFRELAATFDGAALWQGTVAAFGEYLPEGEGLDPWTAIADRIDQLVASETAASFIRLGDAEGNLLALGLEVRPALARHCAASISRQYFGSAHALDDAAEGVLPALGTALTNAALIGFPGPFGAEILLSRDDAEAYARPIQGLASVHQYLAHHRNELGLVAKTGAPAGFHRGLLPHYERLIRGRPVGIVTCRAELADALRGRMGASAVDLRPVPEQAILTDRPDADTGHWPGRYHELTAELRTVDPGQLWLVAAGTFGKVYCESIRAAGAIAVDIGHTADVWAGVRTRVSIKPDNLAAWRIA